MSCIFKPLLLYKLDCETALGYSSILTGLLPFGDKGFSWNGISDAQGLDWIKGSPSEVGACASFNKIGLHSSPCQKPSNFMCEEKQDKNSREWVMSLILIKSLIYPRYLSRSASTSKAAIEPENSVVPVASFSSELTSTTPTADFENSSVDQTSATPITTEGM
jgi:hypothetical protein